MKPKRLKRWIGLLAFAGMAALLLWAALPRERDLLRMAHQIGSTGATPDFSYRPYNVPWYWLSNREVIVLREGTFSIEVPRRDGIKGRAWEGWNMLQAYRLDTVTGKETPAKQMNDRLKDWRLKNRSAMFKACQLSPDGRWMLFEKNPFWHSPEYVVVAADGSRVLRWPREWEDVHSELFWLPDSRAWVRMQYGGTGFQQAEIYSPDAPKAVRTVAFLPNSAGGSAMGFTHDGRLLIGNWRMSDYKGKAYFAAFYLSRPQSPPRLYALPVPHGMEIQWMALSRQGDRLAWMLYPSPYQHHTKTWMQRIRDFLGIRPRQTALELWVSRVDGSDMRQIGFVQDKTNRYTIPKPETCAWSPDGRQIAFTYDFKLWTVNID